MASGKPTGKTQAKQPAQAQPSFGKLYWLRNGTGVLAGLVAYVFFSQTPVRFDSTSNGVLVGIVVYLLTYYLARYVWYRKIDSQFFSKLYTTGIGGYIMLFLFTWILLFTFLSGSI
ncbi:MAG: hypothetical protein LYZ69_02635 [Nitrososphaerales archaeon]|nr:hypothetical protein [Nitrososphaerales archaeon]